eukprot:6457111-Amphidinium_carterae.4
MCAQKCATACATYMRNHATKEKRTIAGGGCAETTKTFSGEPTTCTRRCTSRGALGSDQVDEVVEDLAQSGAQKRSRHQGSQAADHRAPLEQEPLPKAMPKRRTTPALGHPEVDRVLAMEEENISVQGDIDEDPGELEDE